MIKKLTTDKEIEQIQELSSYAFNYKPDADRKQDLNRIYQQTDNWGLTKGEALTSQILVFPFQVNIFGANMKMAGIGNVATYPEYRGEGGIRQLFTAIFADLKEKEIALSYLAPFSQPFYRKFGYEVIFENRETTVNRKEIVQLKNEPKGSVQRVSKTNPTYQKIVKDLYEKTLGKDTGTVIREDWWWQSDFLETNKRELALVFDDEKQPVGYLFYEMIPNEMVLHEIGYQNAFAIRKLASFISSHSGTFETFRYNSSRDEQLSLLFEESRALTQKINHGMMVKILSFETFINAFPFNQVKEKTTLTLGILDSSSSWNQGTWEITLGNGSATAKRISQKIEADAGISGTIQVWTQVFLGHSSLATHLFLERLTATNQQVVDELTEYLPTGPLAIYDYF